MVTLILEAVSPSLRGALSKWMIEPRAGVFVGTLSAAVRERLWKKVCAESGGGRCIMIHAAANEQGFAIRSWGDSERVIDQWEGLYLVRRLPKADDDAVRSAADVMRLWAKSDPFQPLVCHLADVGHVALALLKTAAYRSILDRWIKAADCPPEIAQSWIGYLTALHDWGKAWPNFQCRRVEGVHPSLYEADFVLPNLEDVDKHLRHEEITEFWTLRLLTERGWSSSSARTVASALGMHHSRRSSSAVQLSGFPTQQRWLELKDEVADLVYTAFSPPEWSAEFLDHSAAGLLLLGLTVWADWIASNRELFPLRWQGEEWVEYNALSAIAAERAVAKLGLARDFDRRAFVSFREMWPEFQQPSPVQRAVEALVDSESDLGLVIIEAPMGEGKSEAAFYLANRLMSAGGGLYVALPTAATSNQMFRRVQEFLARVNRSGNANVQLIHGMSWLVDQASPGQIPEAGEGATDSYQAYSWFLPRKRSLLSPFGVGTIDQALMAALHVRFGFLRLFGLAGKVLIIDEVHAYDAYMSEMLLHLLRWCRSLDISVVLLSATLPQERRERLIAEYLGDGAPKTDVEEHAESALPYPLITAVSKSGQTLYQSVDHDGRHREVHIVPHYGLLNDPHGTADLAVRLVGDEGCICVIANTVGSAQQIYESLRERYPDVESLLFHARFLAKHRQRIEEKVLNYFGKASLKDPSDPEWRPRPKRMILVATQVVEQSLDLDFDLMISEIAPIDLLLQRVGRLHRHPRPNRPASYGEVLHVLLPDQGSLEFGLSEKVYNRYLLLRTCTVLEEHRCWSLPSDFRQLIESVYGDIDLDSLDALQGEWLSAEGEMNEEVDKQKREAKKYLIPGPTSNAFKLGRTVKTEYFEEDDPGVRDYLHAKTRYGNDSMRVLMVDSAKWQALSELKRPPSREVLQELMLCTVSVPRHWFANATKKDPYHDLQPAPRWLHVEAVVPLVENRWEGREGSKEVIVEVDGTLGVRRIERGE